MEDTQKELERLQEELLKEEPDILDDKVLEELLKEPEPAFDDPDQIHEPQEPMTYRNFSNDYGRDSEETPDAPAAEQKKDDKVLIGLMITASVLCVGILGVLTYWLTVFLK